MDSPFPLVDKQDEEYLRSDCRDAATEETPEKDPGVHHSGSEDEALAFEGNGGRSSTFALKKIKVDDREAQEALLLHRFNAILSGDINQKELVLIRGAAGTGKTTLAMSLRDRVEQVGGHFLRGKFDQLQQQARGYLPFVVAFSDFVEQVVEQNNVQLCADLGKKIAQATRGEASLVTAMIPALARILGEQPQQTLVHGTEARRRFRLIFCKFVASICSKDAPLVLFLDDLHWSDSESMDLLGALLTDPSIEGLMVLGAFRGDEVSVDSDVSVLLHSLEGSDLHVTKIELSNVSERAIVLLLSETFALSPSDCTFLANIVFEQAGGNIFDTVELVHFLEEMGVICHSNNGKSATVDRAKIKLLGTVNRRESRAMDLVRDRIRRLSCNLQTLLKTAACLGAEFERDTLVIVLRREAKLWEECLRCAVNLGLLISLDSRDSRFSFVHDHVQTASYELIPPEERPSFHLMLGRYLWKACGRSKEVQKRSGLIVEQLRHGLDLIDNEKERLAVADLCLQAGRNAAASSSFGLAASLLETGLSLLPERHWPDCYGLSLNLYCFAAEASDALGRFQRTDTMVSQILQNARSLDDKLAAYTTQIYSLGSRGRLRDAIDRGLNLLDLLGYRLPKNLLSVHILLAYRRLKQLLHGLTDFDILDLPLMTDKKQLSIMRILNILVPYAYTGRPSAFALLALHMTQLSLKHGLSAISAVGFAGYAVLLAHVFRQVEDCHRFGRLAMRILDKFGMRQWVPRVYVAFYGIVVAGTPRTVRERIESLQYAHSLGLATGDVEFAMHAAYLADLGRVISGTSRGSLHKVYEDIISTKRLMVSYGQEYALVFYRLLAQYVSNLRGESDDPLILTGKHSDEAATLLSSQREKHYSGLRQVYFWKAKLAYMLNEYEQTEVAISRFRQYGSKGTSLASAWPMAFVMGSCSLELALNSAHRRRQRVREARRCLRFLKKHAENAPSALLHRVYFLEAKLSLFSGDLQKCLLKFDQSIQFAEREEHREEHALNAEHTGMALIRYGRKDEGRQMLLKAKDLFEQWGATVKVDQMKRSLKIDR